MKLTDIVVRRPIIIDLVNQLVSKDVPVFFTMAGHKGFNQRKKQKRVVRIAMKPVKMEDITRYTITYIQPYQDPADANAVVNVVGVTDRHFAIAKLDKQKDGAWLLNIPLTPFDELPPA